MEKMRKEREREMKKVKSFYENDEGRHFLPFASFYGGNEKKNGTLLYSQPRTLRRRETRMLHYIVKPASILSLYIPMYSVKL